MAIIIGILTAYVLITLPVSCYVGYKIYMRVQHPEKKEGKTGVQQILDAFSETTLVMTSWFGGIALSQDTLKRDSQAMLVATKAIAQSMLDIKGIADKFAEKPTTAKNVESFLYSLEYVRDFYTKTQHQRKVMSVIIDNIRTTHGTERK